MLKLKSSFVNQCRLDKESFFVVHINVFSYSFGTPAVSPLKKGGGHTNEA